MTERNRTAHSPRFPSSRPRLHPNESDQTKNSLALSRRMQQLHEQISPLLQFLSLPLKLSAIVFPIISVSLIIGISLNNSTPFPIDTLNSTIFLIVYGEIFSIFYAFFYMILFYFPLLIITDRKLKEFLFYDRLHLHGKLNNSIIFLWYGFLTFILYVPLLCTFFIVTTISAIYINKFVLIIILYILLSYTQYLIIKRKTITKIKIEDLSSIFYANFMLLCLHIILVIFISKIYISLYDFPLILLLVYFVIIFVIILTYASFEHWGLLGPAGVGFIVFILLLASIGFGKSAEIMLRTLNLGGDIPAQFVVKPEACAMLYRNQAIENKDNGPDDRLVSCTTKPVRVVFDVGDTVYFRSERMKQGDDVTIQYPEDIMLGLDRKYIIGTQNVPERKNQQPQE